MFWNAKNGSVRLGNTEMDYISFGKGRDILVMLPGLGDGLATVKGKAAVLALMYSVYAKNYKMYVFSRKNLISKGYSTRDMAENQARAMALLGIGPANILGISQGGMIAQHLAINHSELVKKLVLAVTPSSPNSTLTDAIDHWIKLAQQRDYKGLMIDTAERSYSPQYLKKYRFLYPLLDKIGKPKSFDRFFIQAEACVRHNALPQLESITCPTLVIGGDCDKIAGKDTCTELAGKIKNSQLHIYSGLGHGAYEEAKNFHHQVLKFLQQ